MSNNRKKIIGTLLGIMASISNAGAMQNTPNTGSANTGIDNSKNEEQNKFKKRGEVKVNRLLKAIDILLKLELSNELASTIPGLSKFSRTIIRPRISNYRIVHGFRGYIMRHDNPSYANSVFKLSGDDGHDFRVRVDKGDNFFIWKNKDKKEKGIKKDCTCDTKKITDQDIEMLKGEFKFSEYLSEPSLHLVAEARVKDEYLNYRLYDFKRMIWNIDDVANAIDKANKLKDIINNSKVDDEQKIAMINKQLGENIVFVHDNNDLNNDELKVRIFLGKKKFPDIDVDKFAKEEVLASDKYDAVAEAKNIKVFDECVNSETKRLNKILDELDRNNDLNCYAEFKLIKKNSGVQK